MEKNNMPFGSRLLEEKWSEINGNIKVVRSLGLGTYIQVEGLTQSGGVVEDVWQQSLKRVKSKKSEVKNCLILGFGGGSAAKLVKKYWSEAKVLGVDVDPVMVELGKKYLGAENTNVITGDAYNFIKKNQNDCFDLILIDTYLGETYPKEFEREDFVKMVKDVLPEEGIAVFNRLYWDEKRKLAHDFEKVLEKVFSSVERFYPEANLMFICSNR